MSEHPHKQNFLICHECQGTGIVAEKKCVHCHGLGAVLFFQDKVLCWDRRIDDAGMMFNQAKRKISNIINIVLAVFGLSGWAVMVYYGYLNGFTQFAQYNYWTVYGLEKAYFGITIVAAIYLYIRLGQQNGGKYFVMSKRYQTRFAHPIDWPAIWKKRKHKLVNISLAFTDEALKTLSASWQLAQKFNEAEAGRLHLLGVFTHFDKSAIILGRLGVDFVRFNQEIGRHFSNRSSFGQTVTPVMSLDLRKLLLVAYVEACLDYNKKVDLLDMVIALAELEDNRNLAVEALFAAFDLCYRKIKNVALWLRLQQDLREHAQQLRNCSKVKAKKLGSTPRLDKHGFDLTLKAKKNELFPCIGRDREIADIFRVLDVTRQGVLLAGESGSGKEAIIEGLAERLAAGDAPEILRDKRLFNLDLKHFLVKISPEAAGDELLLIIDEIIHSGNIILVISNLSDAPADLGASLIESVRHALVKHYFPCIITTAQGQEAGTVFQAVKIEKLGVDDAILVLAAKSGPIEYANKVYFSYDAIEKVASSGQRIGKAIDTLEAAAEKAKYAGKKTVGAWDVI